MEDSSSGEDVPRDHGMLPLRGKTAYQAIAGDWEVLSMYKQ
jgi:hypothetical protein